MFGEMLGIWLMTAVRNNYLKIDDASEKSSEATLNSVNLVEIGPGSGLMMSDIIRVSIAPFFIVLDPGPVHRESQKLPH